MRQTHSKLGKKLIVALDEVAGAIESGGMSRLTVRTVKLPADPMPYDSQAVKRTREQLNVSQAVFARLLGISVVLVQAWEQGLRKPSKMACRLLDEINAAPDRWRQRLVAAVPIPPKLTLPEHAAIQAAFLKDGA